MACVLINVGRHCEVHQMIGNYMWDPSTNKSFDIGVNRDSLMPLWWNGSEPLWVTLTKAKRKVYMYYWPGECVDIQSPPAFQISETVESLKTNDVVVMFEDQARVWKMGSLQEIWACFLNFCFELSNIRPDTLLLPDFLGSAILL